MSEAAGHDVRRLIAAINERRTEAAARIIDPGTEAEQSDAPQRPAHGAATGRSASAR